MCISMVGGGFYEDDGDDEMTMAMTAMTTVMVMMSMIVGVRLTVIRMAMVAVGTINNVFKETCMYRCECINVGYPPPVPHSPPLLSPLY